MIATTTNINSDILLNLRQAEEYRFRLLMEQSSDAMAILSADGKPIYVSPSVKKVIGYTEEESMKLDLLSLAHPDDMQVLMDIMEQAMANPGVPTKEQTTRMLHKDGTWRWVEGTITNMLHDPGIRGIIDNFRDVTEKKQAEEKLVQVNRLYAFISQINQTIVHVKEEQTLFNEVCRIAVDTGKFKVAWIGIVDVENRKLNLVASCGATESDIRLFTNYTYDAGGPTEKVMQGMKYCMVSDICKESEASWKGYAMSRGFNSATVLPVKKSGKVIGTLHIYSAEVNFFDTKEIDLLQEASSDISFALDVLEKDNLRLQATEKLKHSESRLKQALAIGHLGNWEVNYESGIAIWSDEMLKIYGLEPDDYQQSYIAWLSFIHPDDLDYVLQKTKAEKDSLDKSAIHYRIVRKNGIVRHIYSRAYTEFNNEGKAIGLYGVTHDLTEHTLAQEQIKSERNFLRTLIDNLPDAIYYKDTSARKLISNKFDYSLLRAATEAEVLGKTDKELFPEDIAVIGYEHDMEILRTGNPLINYEQDIRIENGGSLWLLTTKLPLRNDKNEIIGLLGIGRDITERKKAEEALRKSEADLQAIFENTSDGFVLTDLDGNIKSFNNKSKNIFFLSSDQQMRTGKSIFDFVPESRKEMYKKAIPKLLAGEDLQYDLSFQKNGETRWFIFTISQLYNKGITEGFIITATDITQRKEAEDKLKKSEFRYRQIVETAQEGIWVIDQDNRTTFVNKKMCEIIGYSKEEMKGKPNYFLEGEEGKQTALEQIERRKQGINEIHESEFITKSGRYIWVNISTNPIFDNDGGYKGALAMVSDITEKKTLEKLLEKANNLARIGNYEANLLNKTHYWSAIIKQIYEVDSDFVPDLSTAINFYKAGANRDAIMLAVGQAIENNIPYDLELQVVTAKGNERWIRVIGEAEFLNSRCSRLYGSIQDIDARKRAELEVLKIYEERNNILESIGDAFFAVDKKWTVTYWNKEAEKILFISKTEIIGNNLWDVFPNSIHTEAYRKYHEAVDNNQVINFEINYNPLNKWFELSAYPSAGGLSVYFRDISQRKQAELERTKMITDIVERNKDLEQFSYIVSHNLRAPLANIMGIAGELNEESNSQELKDMFLHDLSSNAKRLDDIISDLNTILQVKREISEKKEVVNFSKLVSTIQSSIQNLVKKENVRISTDFTEVNEMFTIKSYVHSIFYNLISNSIKYRLPDAAPFIEIKTSLHNGKIIITFKDNGTGIDLAKRGDEVFGLYKRFNHSIEGKGMGLFMVKTQVETLGGKIFINSGINEGTTFNIEF